MCENFQMCNREERADTIPKSRRNLEGKIVWIDYPKRVWWFFFAGIVSHLQSISTVSTFRLENTLK